MASPFVAGLAALVLREAPQLSGYQVRNIILQNVNTFSSLNGKVLTSGRVNALKTMQAAISSVNLSSYNPAYTPVYKTDRSVASVASSSGGAAGCGLVKAGALLGGGSQFSDDDSSSGGGSSSGGIAVVVMLLAGLTLVPAVMSLLGRAAFWPSIPRATTSILTKSLDSKPDGQGGVDQDRAGT